MNDGVNQLVVSGRGIQVRGTTGAEVEAVGRSFLNRLRELGIDHHAQMAADTSAATSPVVEFQLRRESADELAPGGDTTQFCGKLNLDTNFPVECRGAVSRAYVVARRAVTGNFQEDRIGRRWLRRDDLHTACDYRLGCRVRGGDGS